MSVTVHDLPPTVENMKRCTHEWDGRVHLDNGSRRRKSRHFVKLHQEAISGRYYVKDRLVGPRLVKAVRVLAIDGELLNHGVAVLEGDNYG